MKTICSFPKSFPMIIIIACLILLSGQSCKKGPNDPAISFRSRTERLAGSWTVKYFQEVVSASDNGLSSTTTIICNEGAYSETTGSKVVTGSYTWWINIDKKGGYSLEKAITRSVGEKLNYAESGSWFWSEGNKNENIKNKQMVTFHILTSSPDISMQGTPTVLYSWVLDELKNKEIVVNCKWQKTIGTYTETHESTMTLVQ
ncbi:MAG: hypothetical protein WCR01_01540 [Bacteroidota bacterium]